MNDTTHELTDYALQLVHRTAHSLIGQGGYTAHDLSDLKHDLIIQLLERLPTFNPARASYNTFVTYVLEHRARNLLRARRMERRDHRRDACSLNENVDAGDEMSVDRVATISQDEQDLRTGRHTRPALERAELTLDIEAVLASLPANLQRAATLLKTHTPSHVANVMGMTHATFYSNIIEPLRSIFVNKGLSEYFFRPFSDNSSSNGVSN